MAVGERLRDPDLNGVFASTNFPALGKKGRRRQWRPKQKGGESFRVKLRQKGLVNYSETPSSLQRMEGERNDA